MDLSQGVIDVSEVKQDTINNLDIREGIYDVSEVEQIQSTISSPASQNSLTTLVLTHYQILLLKQQKH